jgi:thymidine kinase
LDGHFLFETFTLCGVRCDDSDISLLELGVLKSKVDEVLHRLDFFHIVARRIINFMHSIDVDDGKRTVKTHKAVMRFANVACPDLLIVEHIVRDSNQTFVHSVLHV